MGYIGRLVAGYLGYRWFTSDKTLFGVKKPLDTTTFFVSVVSGINLGLTRLLGTNIGMSILAGRFIFMLTAVVYVATAIYLYQLWNTSGHRIFKV